MSLDLDFNNKEFMDLPEFKLLERDFESGNISHCVAITANLNWHLDIVYALAEKFLGLSKSILKNNNDLIILGELDKAPNIEACRNLINNIALKPVNGDRRLAVILAADKLLKPAANSLLKLAEEPPDYACILFMLDINGRKLMPTLKSRARNVLLKLNLRNKLKSDYNIKDFDWLDFAVKFRNLDYLKAAEVLSDLAALNLEAGDVKSAVRFERLRLIASQRRLSGALLCDLVILAMKEDMPFERLFDDIQQA
ncbi:MAG: hypothetical protein IJ576_05335 [Synergistaceae bacterium]|nr:hypothetical protein [Synergistaceae bacterium]MBR1418370.1 hypothetical protein [Synergistaceae bacterium]MBR1601900.1 hypothetical protein [Synergistaceae bacterium]